MKIDTGAFSLRSRRADVGLPAVLWAALWAMLAATSAQAQGAHHYCPMLYKPVCAVQSVQTGTGVISRRRTFSNACFARIDGARIIHHGPCRRGRLVHRIPRRCKVWHDGCNICVRKRPGGWMICSQRPCTRHRGRPHCRKWFRR